MNLDHHDLERLSGQTGFRAATLEKVIRLGELFADITTHPYLGPRLVLKGGTALHLCPGPPPRLSVDLDFNYVGVLERDTMLAERPEVERALLVLARSSAYQVQHSREAFAGRKFFLDYHGAFGVRDRIEVDLNFLSRLPVLETARAMFWQPGDLPRAEARVLSVEELCAGKLCALLARSAPRDLFDAVRLPERAGAAWTSPRFRSLFVGLAAVLEHPLHRYGRAQLERSGEHEFEAQLRPMLMTADRSTVADLVRHAWELVRPLVTLTDSECEYSDLVQLGELRPELLFPGDRQLADRLRRHPALLWKAKNAAEHRSRSKGSAQL
jgi:hypothetical protein